MSHKPLTYYTRQDLCEWLRISISAIKRYEALGAIHPTKIGPRLVRYSKADVEAFLRRQNGEDPPNEEQS